MRAVYSFPLLWLLTACANDQNTAEFAADSLKQNVYATKDKVEKWVKPDPKLPNQPVAESYCYKTLGDILCYRQPMPGWEFRLVGYQGTDAQSPPPVVTQPLPTHTVDADAQPAARLAKLTPIFVTPPPEVKAATTPQAPVVENMSQESLPDPALAPQL